MLINIGSSTDKKCIFLSVEYFKHGSSSDTKVKKYIKQDKNEQPRIDNT